MNSSFKCKLLELSILPPKKLPFLGPVFFPLGPFYPEKLKFLIFFLDFSFKVLSETVKKILGIDLLEGEMTPQNYVVFAKIGDFSRFWWCWQFSTFLNYHFFTLHNDFELKHSNTS